MNSLRRNCKGIAAIEFAILFPIFIFLIFSIIEFGFLMFLNSLVNNAVTEAGRLGITGSNYAFRQIIEPGKDPLTREEYVEKVLKDKLGTVADYGVLDIKTQKYSNIGTLSLGGGNSTLGFGSSGEIVVYNITFTADILSPLLLPFIGKNGKYVITSQTVLQNEGFNETD